MRRDFGFVLFLVFNVSVVVFSFLFAERMWLFLESSGIGRGVFVGWLVSLGLVVLLSVFFVFVFVRRFRRENDVVVEDKRVIVDKSVKLEEKKEGLVVPKDDARRLRVLEEIERNKSEFVVERKVDVEGVKRGVVYYDNGWMDENNVFHEYESNENDGGM